MWWFRRKSKSTSNFYFRRNIWYSWILKEEYPDDDLQEQITVFFEELEMDLEEANIDNTGETSGSWSFSSFTFILGKSSRFGLEKINYSFRSYFKIGVPEHGAEQIWIF